MDAPINSSQASPTLSVRMASVRRLDSQPVCLHQRPCGLRTHRPGDTYAKLIGASI